MRLIDADALLAEYDRVHVGEPGNARKLIENAPTIEERKTGKWGNHGECPFCSYLRQWKDDKYCANCGAKMEGEQP